MSFGCTGENMDNLPVWIAPEKYFNAQFIPIFEIFVILILYLL